MLESKSVTGWYHFQCGRNTKSSLMGFIQSPIKGGIYSVPTITTTFIVDNK